MSESDKYSAGPQALGYLYQPKLALLELFDYSDDTGLLIEGQDDLEFIGEGDERSLGSLKHKSPDGVLTDLSSDFWKSSRIWLERYQASGRSSSNLQFYLFTTERVSDRSFLNKFVPHSNSPAEEVLENFFAALSRGSTSLMGEVRELFDSLSDEERLDFLGRVKIFDSSPRITDIQDKLLDTWLKIVRREHKTAVLERFEGWWHNRTIAQIAGEQPEPIYVAEAADKLASIADEYRSDNLPINFLGKRPSEVDPENDNRIFVHQLRFLGISTERIQSAIIDYYRAFQQRSLWAREHLLVPDEMEEYEERLIDEWSRYKNMLVESLGSNRSETALLRVGQKLFNWAEFETGFLRIRERVTEAYVVRGAFHILANESPTPRVYWHPEFLHRLEDLLEVVR
jgi:hypothetical protein